MGDESKPLPVPDELTAGYWDAIRMTGNLVIQWCAGCQRYQHFPEVVCGTCGGGELSYRPVSGRGSVYTYVITHHAVVPGFAKDAPYVIAWVELPEQEGLRVLTNIVAAEPGEVFVGMPVELELETRGPMVLPQFRPTSS